MSMYVSALLSCIWGRADQRVLRWFGHVERMDEYHMARRVLMVEVSGGRVRGRPTLGWMDGVKAVSPSLHLHMV